LIAEFKKKSAFNKQILPIIAEILPSWQHWFTVRRETSLNFSFVHNFTIPIHYICLVDVEKERIIISNHSNLTQMLI
jgi:hypothetical protein